MVVTRKTERKNYSALHKGEYLDVLTGQTSAKKAKSKSKKKKSLTKEMSGTEGSPVLGHDQERGVPVDDGLTNPKTVHPEPEENGAGGGGEKNKDGAGGDITADLSPDELARKLDEAEKRNAALRAKREATAQRQRLAALLSENQALEDEIGAASTLSKPVVRGKSAGGRGSAPQQARPQRTPSDVPEPVSI